MDCIPLPASKQSFPRPGSRLQTHPRTHARTFVSGWGVGAEAKEARKGGGAADLEASRLRLQAMPEDAQVGEVAIMQRTYCRLLLDRPSYHDEELAVANSRRFCIR